MLRSLILFVALSLIVPGVSLAQLEPPAESLCWIREANGSPTGTQLQIEVWVDADLDPEVYGFDIYRKVTGECGDRVRVTDEPFLRGLPGVYEFNLVDGYATSPGTEYVYYVEVVDPERNILDGWLEFDYFEYLAFAWHGSEPLVGMGTIVSGFPWQLDPCTSSCFGQIWINSSPAVDGFANTGIEVMLYGTTFCNWEGCFVIASSVFPVECGPVPARVESWSSLKAKFD